MPERLERPVRRVSTIVMLLMIILKRERRLPSLNLP
jgi:hypothetical protein